MTCLFCKIAAGEIPATIVFENDELMVLRDIAPQAPEHLLVIPKRHISTIDDTTKEDDLLLGHMVRTAKEIATVQGMNKPGYRLVFNVNAGGGQAVYHIHLHLLGGRQMNWPPG